MHFAEGLQAGDLVFVKDGHRFRTTQLNLQQTVKQLQIKTLLQLNLQPPFLIRINPTLSALSLPLLEGFDQNKIITSMQQSQRTASKEMQAYRVTINTLSFGHSQSSAKEKAQKELIPHYWNKFHMDRKRIIPSREDRLSRLTTKQIDRIIDMQKIRSLLYDKKRSVTGQYFQYDTSNPNIHSNVFKANFLARINDIAIKRNVRPESEVTDDLMHQNLKKLKENSKINSKSQVRVVIANAEQTIRSVKRPSKERREIDDEKSIGEIEVDLQQFEEKLEERKKRTIGNGYRKTLKTEYKLIPSNRWFYGMSTHYLDKGKPASKTMRNQCYRSNYDIESQLRESQHRVTTRSIPKRDQPSTRTSRSSSQHRGCQPFQAFKLIRLVTLD